MREKIKEIATDQVEHEMIRAGLCKSKISFGDDFGDNETTFECELKNGHKGKHHETGKIYEEQLYELYWEDKK